MLSIAAATLFPAVLNADPTGEQLYRVFTTPDERARVDAMRARGLDLDPVVSDKPAKVTNRASMNGWVQRNGALAEVWVNGERLVESEGLESGFSLLLGPDKSTDVVISRQNGSRARLKPGQAWDLSNNEVIDCVACEKVNAEVADALAETGAESLEETAE